MGSIIEWNIVMYISDVSRVSNISSIFGVNVRDIFWICVWRLNLILSSLKRLMYLWIRFNFDSSMIYLPVRLLIFTLWSCNRSTSLLIVRALRWSYRRVSTSPRRKDTTRSCYLVPSTPSWVLMAEKTTIRRSKKLSLFMYVTSLTWNFGAFDEDMVVYLIGLSLSALENSSKFSCDVAYLGCVYGGRINLEMLWCSALNLLYGGQILYVDGYWHKEEINGIPPFWSWIWVSPSMVTNERCLVNCDAWEWKYGDLRIGHLIISAEGR